MQQVVPRAEHVAELLLLRTQANDRAHGEEALLDERQALEDARVKVKR